MSAVSAIEWTDRTWNPVRGCSVISPGCVNCYAMKQAHRFQTKKRPDSDGDLVVHPGPFFGLTKQTKAGPQWTGTIRTVESALLEPLSWRKPARIFVNSMSDLFHEGVSFEFVDRVFAVMAPRHTFQILTKRAECMFTYMQKRSKSAQPWKDAARSLGYSLEFEGLSLVPWPLPNVWLGVSVEDQQRADERIPLLLQTPAAVRFISAEPLLGPVDLEALPSVSGIGRYLDALSDAGAKFSDVPGRLDWVIVGGESGPGARPCDIAWIRSIVAQCQRASVPLFVKQMGSRITGLNLDGPPYSSPPCREGFLVDWTCDEDNTFGLCDRKGGDPEEWADDLRVRQFPGARV